MPVVQVTGTQQPPSVQSSLRQMMGEILQWTPDTDPQVVKRMIQDTYRRVVDSRPFYGTLVKGQVTVPNAYTTGTVSVTNGNDSVTGTGTTWTNSMVGEQFRIGFSTPIYTITNVLSPTSLTLDLPWGGQTQASLGYQIFQCFVNFGANVKYMLAVVNQIQGYKLQLNIPQEVLNTYDTWRTNMGWVTVVANYPPSPTGIPQYELYPPPTYQQAFPFLAYTQPPDLINDADSPVVSVRSDVIVYGALAQALLFRGKNNKYYDPNTATYFQRLFEAELQKNKLNDNNLYQRDMVWEFASWPFSQFGATFLQSHEFMPE
jgi:hypothetical protein